MPAIARQETYRSAIDTAMTELNQISEQLDNLFVRKERLEKATEGLKTLLGSSDSRMQGVQSSSVSVREMEPQGNFSPNGGMPQGDFSPVMRFPDRAE